MANIQTVSGNEGFIVQINGDYNVPFDEIKVTGTFKSGTVLEDASTAVGSASTAVLGVIAEDVDGVDVPARVMVRGNPSTVNAQELEIADAVAGDVFDLLSEKDIVVVNK